jgi:outer membrane protein
MSSWIARAAVLLSGSLGAAMAQTPLTDHLVGDVGVAAYGTQNISRGSARSWLALPYLYADYGRWLARADTFGFKTLPLGWGYLELLGRVSVEGFRPATLAALSERGDPIPLGLGSFQETPWGGIFVNAFRDTRSGGTLLETTWAGEWAMGRWTWYPQAGFERRSARYVKRLYGVSADQAQASGLVTYLPGASVSPVLGFATEYQLDERWVLTLQWRRRWLDRAITQSPLVRDHQQDSGLLALSYRFK